MQVIDLKCEGEQLEDGTCNLTITICGLTAAQANRLSDRLAAPVRRVVHATLGEGGAELHSRDLTKPLS